MAKPAPRRGRPFARLPALFLLSLCGAASAAGFNVDSTIDAADANPGDGLCATASGDCTLRAAVQESNALPGADQIELPAGDYQLVLGEVGNNVALDGDLDILDDLAIRGAGRQASIIRAATFRAIHIVAAEDQPAPRVELSDLALRDGPADRSDGSLLLNGGDLLLQRIAVAAGGSGSVALRNEARLELRDSLLSDNQRALYNAGQHLLVVDCEFRDNGSATDPDDGAALNNQSGFAELRDSLFIGNNGQRGGAIYNRGELRASGLDLRGNAAHWGGALYNAGSAWLADLVIADNRADLRNTGHGGGITSTGALQLQDSAVTGNLAKTFGGGIHANGGSLRLLRVRLSDNLLDRPGGDGGGLMISELDDGQSAALADLRIAGNSVPDLGGGLASKRPFELLRSQLSGNSARRGGGVYSSAISARIADSSLADNAASDAGGGLYLGPTSNASSLDLGNVTVAGNAAAAGLGANLHRYRGALRLTASIVAAPLGGSDCFGAIESLGGNLDSDTSCALAGPGDLPGTDAQLGPLADNGGDSLSMLPAAGSPAIGAAAAVADGCARLDQRRHYRAATGCDAGALAVASQAAQGGVIAFAAADGEFGEADGVARISVLRSAGAEGPASVRLRDFGTGSASATPAAYPDYTALAETELSWADGEDGARELLIELLDDFDEEGHETLQLDLFGASGAALAEPARTTLTLLDDEVRHGELSFTSAGYAVDESTTALRVELARTNGERGAVSVAVRSEGLGASAGEDFVAVDRRLHFADGETAAAFELQLLPDELIEGEENLRLYLRDPDGGAVLGNWPEVLVSIRDDDQPQRGSLAFAVASLSAGEGDGELRVAVQRTGGSDGAVSVAYVSSNVSAAAGADYAAVDGRLQFADGQSSAEIVIALLDDASHEGDEQFNLRLSDPQGGAELGRPLELLVELIDDDPEPQPGSLQWAQSAVEADESGGPLTLRVERIGGSDGAVSVRWATQDGSAVGGEDFVAAAGSLQFTDGQSSAEIAVELLDDTAHEGAEQFALQLSDVQGGATLGQPAALSVTLLDDDPAPQPGSLQWAQSAVEADESGGPLTLRVERIGGSDGAVSVRWATQDGSAVGGEDFVAAAGSLQFTDGQSSAEIAVELLDDALAEDRETFTVQLAEAGGGAVLGAPLRIEVSVQDADSDDDDQTSGDSGDDSGGGAAGGWGLLLLAALRRGLRRRLG